MRRVCLVAALWLAGACNDDDAKRPEPSPTDAGVKTSSDAGVKPASKLEKPGTLPRAPKGLPDDLRPPR
jgi:hypothetical protein